LLTHSLNEYDESETEITQLLLPLSPKETFSAPVEDDLNVQVERTRKSLHQSQEIKTPGWTRKLIEE